MAAQVAFHGPEDVRVIVNGPNDGFRHTYQDDKPIGKGSVQEAREPCHALSVKNACIFDGFWMGFSSILILRRVVVNGWSALFYYFS
jgi:hypothetical protein